jgi:hypothetical protein
MRSDILEGLVKRMDGLMDQWMDRLIFIQTSL